MEEEKEESEVNYAAASHREEKIEVQQLKKSHKPISSQQSTITDHILRIAKVTSKATQTVGRIAPFNSQESKQPEVIHV